MKTNPFDLIKEPTPTFGNRPQVTQAEKAKWNHVPTFYCQAHSGGKIGQHPPCKKQCTECKQIVIATRKKNSK